MIFWMQIALAFVIGVLANKLWNVVLSTGYSIIVLRQLQDDSLRLVATAAQTLAEIQQIKYMEMHKAGKSEKEIEVQQALDEYYSQPLKELIIKNYIRAFPVAYKTLLKFSDWNSAMEYTDELIKKEKQYRLR